MILDHKKLLISSCAGLGDLIMFTPAIRALKEKFPTLKITFMASEKNADILRRIPYIDKVVCIRRGKFLGRYRVLPDLVRQDIVLFTDWQPQLLLAAKLSCVKDRMGIPKPGHSLNTYFTKMLTVNVMKSPEYAAVTNAKLFMEALEVELDGDMTRCDSSLPDAENHKRVDELVKSIGMSAEQSYVLLTPFAGLEQRNWPVSPAAEFAARVEAKYGLPVLVAGPKEWEKEAKKISRYSLSGKTSTMELVELIRRAKLLVTPDSGPMHIAGALGVPVIPLFSKDLPSRWAPKHNCYPITLNLPCAPCDDATARTCADVQCMRGITADRVINEMENNRHEFL